MPDRLAALERWCSWRAVFFVGAPLGSKRFGRIFLCVLNAVFSGQLIVIQRLHCIFHLINRCGPSPLSTDFRYLGNSWLRHSLLSHKTLIQIPAKCSSRTQADPDTSRS